MGLGEGSFPRFAGNSGAGLGEDEGEMACLSVECMGGAVDAARSRAQRLSRSSIVGAIIMIKESSPRPDRPPAYRLPRETRDLSKAPGVEGFGRDASAFPLFDPTICKSANGLAPVETRLTASLSALSRTSPPPALCR